MSRVGTRLPTHEKAFGSDAIGSLALICVLIVMAAFGTALVSHLVVDALGDFLLAHDAYDNVGRHSSYLVVTMAGIAACGLVLHLLIAASRDARGSHTNVRRTLARAGAAPVRGFSVVATISAAMLLLLAMGSFDSYAAGAPRFDAIAALGGSLWLSLCTTCIVGFICGSVVFEILRRLGRRTQFWSPS